MKRFRGTVTLLHGGQQVNELPEYPKRLAILVPKDLDSVVSMGSGD